MKVLFYLDRLMHYHEATFLELERRLERDGGTFVVISGQKRTGETGRVGISKTQLRSHYSIPFYELGFGSYTMRWQPTLVRQVRKLAPDAVVVMGHVGCVTYWRLGVLRKRLGFRYLDWQCGYEYHPTRFKAFFASRFLRRFDYHLAYHSEAKKYLLAHGVPERRITVIHNTIDEREVACIPRAEARQKVVKELGLPIERPIVLFVGAILHEKRLDLLLNATRLMTATPVSLVIVGDGPALAEVKSWSADLGYVKYTGRVVEDVGRFFDAADVFVLPGTGGLAINEAMAHGLPVVTARGDGSALDLVTDGANGYILKTAEPDELATHLATLLNNPVARLEMGKRSRELITDKFSFGNFVKRIMDGLYATKEGKP